MVSLSKKDFVSVTRQTMRASTAVPISITKRQGGTFIRRSIWRKLAELFEVPLENLLDDYNLFLFAGTGEQIKAIRQRLGLTQKA